MLCSGAGIIVLLAFCVLAPPHLSCLSLMPRHVGQRSLPDHLTNIYGASIHIALGTGICSEQTQTSALEELTFMGGDRKNTKNNI